MLDAYMLYNYIICYVTLCHIILLADRFALPEDV